MLRRVSLPLLLCFDSLMQTRSVTATASKLNKSQPAISRDLARLRELIADPLFVVVRKKLVPTERALAIYEQLHQGLCGLEQALEADETFTPSALTGVVNIGAAAHIELLLAAPLTTAVQEAAPGLIVRFHPVHGDVIPDDLDSARMDLAIGLFQTLPPRFPSRLLFEDERVCVVSKSHPLAKRRQLTLNDLPHIKWLAFSHMYGTETNFDRALRHTGRQMNFSAYVSNFGLTPYFLMETDYATTMPKSIADKYQRHFELAQIRLPKELKAARMIMAWGAQNDSSRLNRWIRSIVLEVVNAFRVQP